jgi:dienelactone hydrolase
MIVFLELPMTNFTRGRDPQRVMALGFALMGGGLALLAFGSGPLNARNLLFHPR